jgi:DNA repair protein RadC
MLKEKPSRDASRSGHRRRLRERFIASGGKGMPDYEILELLLFAAHPRGDVKPLAKNLLKQFGSFSKVLGAEPATLAQVDGIADAAVTALKVVEAAAQRMLLEKAQQGPIIGSWTTLLDYCKVAMAEQKVEQFRVLFLNHKNELIKDEIQQRGTVDHTPVYPREVVKRALELNATALILAHNHPSGDTKPSKADIDMTRKIIDAARPLGIFIHDHLIIGRYGHYSFKSNGLI